MKGPGEIAADAEIADAKFTGARQLVATGTFAARATYTSSPGYLSLPEALLGVILESVKRRNSRKNRCAPETPRRRLCWSKTSVRPPIPASAFWSVSQSTVPSVSCVALSSRTPDQLQPVKSQRKRSRFFLPDLLDASLHAASVRFCLLRRLPSIAPQKVRRRLRRSRFSRRVTSSLRIVAVRLIQPLALSVVTAEVAAVKQTSRDSECRESTPLPGRGVKRTSCVNDEPSARHCLEPERPSDSSSKRNRVSRRVRPKPKPRLRPLAVTGECSGECAM